MRQAQIDYILSLSRGTRRYILTLEELLVDEEISEYEFLMTSQTILDISNTILNMAIERKKELKELDENENQPQQL